MGLLTWVGDEKNRTAKFHRCVFTLQKLKLGYRLRGRGTMPPDSGFSFEASGGESSMMQHAEMLAETYLSVTKASVENPSSGLRIDSSAKRRK
jgi:hypothetical protein